MIFETPPRLNDPLRAAIDGAFRADETACVRALLGQIDIPEARRVLIEKTARKLVEGVRETRVGKGGIDAFLHEYGLSSQEGVALMCVAEALLRIPDDETRERLIRDKFTAADWDRHLGKSGSLFVNASTWALMLTGRVIRLAEFEGQSVGAMMLRLVAHMGEPVIREAVTQAMRILGRQFVMGRTIEEALERGKAQEKRGYRHSYDMLGEAARTAGDAQRYFDAYRRAIAAIGQDSAGKGVVLGPGISVKLSALHPRYELAQRRRVMEELVPRLLALARDARERDIGLAIDAEEVDRLDISLDVVEAVSGESELQGWNGLGVVVQAYQKRAPFVLDWLSALAKRHGRCFMIRLVKGAYWDSEIKKSQERGLKDYPVYTRKVSTDLAYLVCAQKLLADRAAFFPQFATHNAHTVAAVRELAGVCQDYEFQRLHGMGEALYDLIVPEDRMGIPCRIYAPVGQHEDLLAYLVRRLLENGANTSFVNRIQDERLPVEDIIADPIARLQALPSIRHPRIPPPPELYGPSRRNAKGVDLFDRAALLPLAGEMGKAASGLHRACPIVGGEERSGVGRPLASPADRCRVVGEVVEAEPEDVERALVLAEKAVPAWRMHPVEERAACLERAALLMEAGMSELMTLAVLEAGKALPDAVAEVREAVDFLRYYAMRARQDLGRSYPLRVPGHGGAIRLEGRGVFVCISPWNFPLAIFTGQVAAALVAGNAVIAKPAEQTPLIAAMAVRLLHEAGVPGDVLHLLPGDGETVGGRLTADPRVAGVCFTGSTEVAKLIERTLAKKAGPPATLIAETGGQNAMIVDSTALPEQVVTDVLTSAFQSAGQRCSALRVLFLQEDVADPMLEMLAGAMDELVVGDPSLLSTDVGPVIDVESQAMLEGHMKRMLGEGRLVRRVRPGPRTEHGSFVGPATFEIDSLRRLQREVFGPILHVIRYPADRLDGVIETIRDTGYGLTMGIHSRIDDTMRHIWRRSRVGNTYVNRNQIGAVVGVQPFGGEGLSGTGPKAGGPHYVQHFTRERLDGGPIMEASLPASDGMAKLPIDALGRAKAAGERWGMMPARERASVLERAAGRLEAQDQALMADHLHLFAKQVLAEMTEPLILQGPTGERNELSLHSRGVVVCLTSSDVPPGVAAAQVAAALSAGNAVVAIGSGLQPLALALAEARLPQGVLQLGTANRHEMETLIADLRVDVVAFAGPLEEARVLKQVLAARDGKIVPLVLTGNGGETIPSGPHYLHAFTIERVLTIDTTAAGGNTTLLSLEEGM
jgi:RHH-type transcriptional regulator, proline utilization regulon repressor / proline dehydrogenase / delta 1-pyrroline-5-carboxylate dehydrogenase